MQIRVQNHENLNQEFPLVFKCPICPYTSENLGKYQEHLNYGPFAENHILQDEKHNATSVICLILANIRCQENEEPICRHCLTGVQLDDIMKTYEHITQHGQNIVGDELALNLVTVNEIRKIIKRELKNNNPNSTISACFKCMKIFTSPENLLMHVSTFKHDVMKHYCNLCKEWLETDVKNHLELEHQNLSLIHI